MTMSGMEVKVIVIDGTTYTNMGAASGDMWTVTDPATSGLDASATDPAAQLRLLEQAVTSATLVGTEDVNGVSAEHWTVVLDPTLMGMAAAEGVPAEITQEVWLDSEGRTVKSTMDMEVAGTATTTTTTMGDFGAPVSIAAPPADQISAG